MAVAERTFNDQTGAAINALLNLGGKKETSTSSASASPEAIAALTQVLGNQNAYSTPEGAAALVRAIFEQGMREVPALATTYAQAAGARASSNSPFQFALQDLMTRLSAEGAKQVVANQANASQTAGRLADATRTESKTVVQKAKASPMQALPFVLANAGKLRGLLPKDLANSLGLGGAGTAAGTAVDGVNFGTSNVNPTGADNFSLASDFGSSATEALGGGLDSALEFFGGEPGNILDYATPATDLGIIDAGSSFGGDGSDFFNNVSVPDFSSAVDPGDFLDFMDVTDFFGFAQGGHVDTKKMPGRMRAMKAPGYARGGAVRGYRRGGNVNEGGGGANTDIKSVGALQNQFDEGGGKIRGFTYNGGFNLGQALAIGLARAANAGLPNQGGAGLRGGRRKQEPLLSDTSIYGPEAGSAGSSGIGEGIATGPTGGGLTAGGIAAVAAIGSMISGIPAAAISFALSHSPMSAVNQSNADAASVADTVGGMSGPATTTSDGITTSGMSTTADTSQTALDAALDAMGISTSNTAVSGLDNASLSSVDSTSTIGDTGIGAGSSSGGADGVGDAAAAGVGGGGFRKGGDVQGPGTSTSDSILARLSDNEYVLNANAVEALGVPFLDMINHVMFPAARPAREYKGR